jgi:hypothetical protein
MADGSALAKRVTIAVVALGAFAAAAVFALPRLVNIGSASPTTPVPGPSVSETTLIPHRPLFFATEVSPSNAYPDSGTGGTVVADRGCILLESADGRELLVIWPYGWSIESTDGGGLQILDESGTAIAEVGEYVELHGGIPGWYPTDPRERFAEEFIGRPIPPRCEVGNYFTTSGQRLD